jgi:hypothetical protein
MAARLVRPASMFFTLLLISTLLIAGNGQIHHSDEAGVARGKSRNNGGSYSCSREATVAFFTRSLQQLPSLSAKSINHSA